MKKRPITLLCVTLVSAMLFAGCGKKEEPAAVTTPTPTPTQETPTPTPMAAVTATETPTPTPTPEPEPALPEGKMYSYLTGEVIDEQIGKQRPIAVMINNIQDAIPQSGVPQADIVYELMVEGTITRMMAVFQDTGDLTKIGPVRSLRHSYIDFAHDNEAWIVHCGGSNLAYDRVAAEGIQTLDVGGDEVDSFRSWDRVAPHNMYLIPEGAKNRMRERGMDFNYPEGYEPNLLFNEEDTDLADGATANTIRIPSFPWNNPYFTYDEGEKVYLRYEYDYPQNDMETGEQFRFKNVVVQYVSLWNTGDGSGHMDMTLYGEGRGLYFTNGKCIPITWKKSGNDDNTRYYDANGEQIKLNPGKTMFEVVGDGGDYGGDVVYE